jgi:polar amino acid transport system substrate-binding protein
MIEQVPPAVRDVLAPTGRLIAAINYGNVVLAQKDPGSGEPRGVSADLARELARRLQVPVEFVAFEAAGKVADTAAAKIWDIAFLAIDPKRAAEIDFTPPYVIIEAVYVVPAESPLTRIEDVDQKGVRVAVGKGAAYDLYLTRTLQQAQLVRAPTSAAALATFASEGLEAAAGVREFVTAFAASRSGFRVLDHAFMTIRQAMAMPKGRPAGAAYLSRFVEEMKASGFVADALVASGQTEAKVAPPESA